jgi:hypothetical protein
MAYSTTDDIINEIRGLEVTGTTVVKEDDLSAWIKQADAYIDGRLAAYYITPITGAKSLSIVKTISIYKVAHRVKNKLELTSENSDKKQEVQANLDKQAERMLEQLLPKIVDGRLIEPLLKLPDTATISRSPEGAALTSIKAQGGTFIKNGNNW